MYKYLIVIFRNKEKRKVLKSFKTFKRANDYYDSLCKKSDEVIFDVKTENGFECKYEIALLEYTKGTMIPMFIKDEIGRQVKIELSDSNHVITKISNYKIEEEILDYQTKKKITTQSIMKKYLNNDGLKLISKLNNKIIIQNDDELNLFTFKNESDSNRFVDTLSVLFLSQKRGDCLFVKDTSSPQKKYLYNLLTERGYPKSYLFRNSTTHLTGK